MTSFSVVIPTYLRPDWIERAVHSLARQSRVPDEVVCVARDSDQPTHAAVHRLAARLGFPVRLETVAEPGFIPPVERGMWAAKGDVIGLMDDDAEAQPGWSESLLRHYQDPRVGAVGGRCINVDEHGVLDVPATDRVAFISATGRVVGDMYKRPTFDHPVEAAFLMAGCMSVRRDVRDGLEFDRELNRSVAFGYEVDVGLQIARMGWRLIFDPAVAIHHYSAPRQEAGMRRVDNAEAARWASHNRARVALRRMAPRQALVVFGRDLLIGTRRAPGLVPWGLTPLARRAGFVTEVARSAAVGRLQAGLNVIRAPRFGR
jgi:GT2 family glycosyltransferase